MEISRLWGKDMDWATHQSRDRQHRLLAWRRVFLDPRLEDDKPSGPVVPRGTTHSAMAEAIALAQARRAKGRR